MENGVLCASTPSLLLRTRPSPKRTKTTLTANELDINITIITLIIQQRFNTLKGTAPSPLLTQKCPEDTQARSFSI